MQIITWRIKLQLLNSCLTFRSSPSAVFIGQEFPWGFCYTGTSSQVSRYFDFNLCVDVIIKSPEMEHRENFTVPDSILKWNLFRMESSAS